MKGSIPEKGGTHLGPWHRCLSWYRAYTWTQRLRERESWRALSGYSPTIVDPVALLNPLLLVPLSFPLLFFLPPVTSVCPRTVMSAQNTQRERQEVVLYLGTYKNVLAYTYISTGQCRETSQHKYSGTVLLLGMAWPDTQDWHQSNIGPNFRLKNLKKKITTAHAIQMLNFARHPVNRWRRKDGIGLI